ncbi:putative uncharacterized protein [Tetragenococcus halophilus subsp. halophilus]|uniref:DUF1642 domain-containing protein n=1 Tax=Tetragenococcus halophilus TaxID=51669 RepID=UPI000CB51A26|nr:DUF1642 domain-containing protein [Tetragenococcus halophilus]GBD73856.1 putative uncharacterized protein [Tetragenococcus halophilus subsp. halophilus]
MNKQELLNVFKNQIIKESKDVYGAPDTWIGGYEDGRIDALTFAYKRVKWLDAPEKPEIPKFVADWIRGFRILDVTDLDIIGLYFSKEIEKKCEQWITDNFNDFIKALVNGYTEKAPVWIVKAPYDRYFGGFLEKGQHAEINFSHINRDNAQKFEDKNKAKAVATLIDGTVEEWSE